MRSRLILLLVVCLAAAAIAGVLRRVPHDEREEVRAHELALAATMAARDFDGFAELLAGDAVLIGKGGAWRGKPAIMRAWRRLYDGDQAPFAWMPDMVEVAGSGTLGYASGPVFAPDGRETGTFHSVWRLEAPGRWRLVFARGYSVD